LYCDEVDIGYGDRIAGEDNDDIAGGYDDDIDGGYDDNLEESYQDNSIEKAIAVEVFSVLAATVWLAM